MSLKFAQYQTIRDRFSELERTGCNVRLYQLKLHFQDEIGSQRVFERINTLLHLLTVLEKRYVIGCTQVTNLKYIADIVAPQDELIQTIIDGRVEDILNWNNNSHYQLPINSRVLAPEPQNYIDKIHKLIKSNLGKKWKELARALAIDESNIDALDDRYRGYFPDILNEILRLHCEDCGAHFELWRSKLQDALVRARRRDLSVKIDSILTFMPRSDAIH